VYIQHRLGVTDRETVALITKSPYFLILIGLSGNQPLQPFDPSMMVHFGKRIGPDLMKVCNDMTKANGITMNQELLAEAQQENGPDQEDRKQLAAIDAEFGVKLATLEPGSNWGLD
jgi:IS5 family transposase